MRVCTGFRLLAYPIPRGCAAAYYPEVNPLIALDSTAVGSNCPTAKSIVIRLEPAALGRTSSIKTSGKPVGADNHHKSAVEPYHLS